MISKTLSNIESLPILFAYIGWAERYDGTEPIEGDFAYFKKNQLLSRRHAHSFLAVMVCTIVEWDAVRLALSGCMWFSWLG